MNLCDHCRHCRTIRNDRGSVFLMCTLSFIDAAFPKYPRLPVLECRGYEKNPEGEGGGDAHS
jgi:hypothetical protein